MKKGKVMRHNRFKFHQGAHWVPHTPAEAFGRSLQQIMEKTAHPNVTHTERTQTTKKSPVRLHGNNRHITWVKLKKKKNTLRRKSHSCFISSHRDALPLEVTQEAVMIHTWNSSHFHFSYVSRLAQEIQIFPPAPAPRPSNTDTFSQKIHNTI